MFLKNYTSNVPVSETVHNIERVLIRCGVAGIAKEYSSTATGKIVAITFRIAMPQGPALDIRLPVDEEAALQAMWLDYVDGEKLNPAGDAIIQWGTRKRKCRKDFIDQAQRTAWKIVQDWVEVQLSMIQLKQADFLQVFLPYVWDGRRTYYAHLKESNFRAMLPESTTAT